MSTNNKIVVLPNDEFMDVLVHQSKFTVVCSGTGKQFNGTMSVTYFPTEVILDFVAFGQWVKEQADQKHTAESFARHVYDALFKVLDTATLSVRVLRRTINHGDIEVSVSKPVGERGFEVLDVQEDVVTLPEP